MSDQKPTALRFFGLDIHKHYLVATGVDKDGAKVYGPRRVIWADLNDWRRKTLTGQDALVIEMTTNTWEVYDQLAPHVHSLTVVHPPHVHLVTEPMVMNDKIAALNLAVLLAKGMLKPIWIPPEPVRELRALLAQRNKMTRLSTQAMNRLHAALHRRHILPGPGDLFHPSRRNWWLALALPASEKVRLLCDLDTLSFARQQVAILEDHLCQLAAQEPRLPLLLQLPGFSIINSLAVLAAIGDIYRFPAPKHLVGYAGLGGRVHNSGQSSRSGKITKSGRRDLRTALVQAAQTAANTHPFWQAELQRLQPRLGRNKTIVVIARKLLVATWHILTFQCADIHAEPVRVARKFLQSIYTLGLANRPTNLSAAAYVRQQLDFLHLGLDLSAIPWGQKKKPIPLPPSSLTG